MSDEQIRTSLSAAIMNLPCVTPDTVPLNAPNEVRAYMIGHRDVRHAAAELAGAALAPAGVEPLFYVRLLADALYEGPYHARSQHGKELRYAKPGEWVGLYVGAAPTAPTAPLQAINRMLEELMAIAVSNGANSISMPDDYVAVAAWLAGIKLTAAPQPAREPLTDKQIEAAAKELAEVMDYPWRQMPDKGRKAMRENARRVLAAADITIANGGAS